MISGIAFNAKKNYGKQLPLFLCISFVKNNNLLIQDLNL